MKGITARARRFTLPKTVEKVLLIVSSLLIFDVIVAVLGASYLSENVETFLGKSETVIVSDLLFLEGAVIFAIGTFIAVAKAMKETKSSSESTADTSDNVEATHKKRIHLGMLMIIAGAILFGLSILLGTLLG